MRQFQPSQYNLINNLIGWGCFVIAAVCYLLTMEPTASFWDCPEYIIQGYKLEVGHPPGNPIFMLAARFFVNFAFGDVTKVAVMVNTMSSLLAAGTILLLFWTITHLVRRLVVGTDIKEGIDLRRLLIVMGSGVCGALMYAWSDTFWFSAVEGEVYSFSSFCTALVFWLILKWENRADDPSSDRYLILIAYVIGISIAVHLLNLLCIPAIVLVIYYRKWANPDAKGSLIALCISAVIVALILYGLVPGFVEIAQYFELFFVNVLHTSYNFGVLIYAVLLVASIVWAVASIVKSENALTVRLSVFCAVMLSGLLFIGSSLWIPVILGLGLIVWLFTVKKLPMRVLYIAMLCIGVIFTGYSSYALLLIRSSAHPQMNQSAPDNVFSLASYLNREQYGETPLLYGRTINSGAVYQETADGSYLPINEGSKKIWGKVVKASDDEPDRYIVTGTKTDYRLTPELNMLFPRLYSGAHAALYKEWVNLQGQPVDGTLVVDRDGNVLRRTPKVKPTVGENIEYLLGYQLNHMYWRYFLWNFAGRQNDIQGNGEPNHGNWISGIPVIDNARLGDQSVLPEGEGSDNKGHNVFYMLPLIMGIIGLLWQAFVSKRGIEQFWVIFFLFFMTGIAIVLYLNQTPGQPRERDYAYAGSFYAYAIWVGMGVAAIAHGLSEIARKKGSDKSLWPALAACAVGLFVPLQVVSQTWDDHDRSGRRTTADFGANYLNSLDPNAIIFTNGDNDTFPLWYAQEVEGVRTDVKVVNQSYLTTDWYARDIMHPFYDAKGIDLQAKPTDFAYDRLQFSYFAEQPDTMIVDAIGSLKDIYASAKRPGAWGPEVRYPNVVIPVDLDKAIADGHLTREEASLAYPFIATNLMAEGSAQHAEGLALNNVLTLDMIATSMANGWDRPIYFAMTVPNEFYLGLSPFMRQTGMAYEVNPVYAPMPDGYSINVNTDRSYDNIVNKFRWGGLDTAPAGSLYLDETVRKMVSTVRKSMIDLAEALAIEGAHAEDLSEDTTLSSDDRKMAADYAVDRYTRARTVLNLMMAKLPGKSAPYTLQDPETMATIYFEIGRALKSKADTDKALELMLGEIRRYGRNVLYYQSLSPSALNAMTRTDRYIDQAYVPHLLQVYSDMGGDAESAALELQQNGVDLNRLFRYVN